MRIALSATPYSGKSTVAHRLRDRYGFTIADHSLTLVRDFVAYNNGHGMRLSVEEVYENKEKYRRGLQDYGYMNGFNDARKVAFWIEMTLAEWRAQPEYTSVVFDSVRNVNQASYLRSQGFYIVRLAIGDDERRRRVEAMGRSWESVQNAIEAQPQLEKDTYMAEVTLYASKPVDEIVEELIEEVAEYHGRAGRIL